MYYQDLSSPVNSYLSGVLYTTIYLYGQGLPSALQHMYIFYAMRELLAANFRRFKSLKSGALPTHGSSEPF